MAFVPGMPSDLQSTTKHSEKSAQPTYEEQQREKKSGGSSSSSSNSGHNGMPSDVENRLYGSTTSTQQSSSTPDPYSSNSNSGHNGMPSSIENKLYGSQKTDTKPTNYTPTSEQNKNVVENFIDKIPSNSNAFGATTINTSNVLAATNVTSVYNAARESLKTENYIGELGGATFATIQHNKEVNEKRMAWLPTEVQDKINKAIESGKASSFVQDGTTKGYSNAAKILKYSKEEADKTKVIPGFEELLDNDTHFTAEDIVIPVNTISAKQYVNLFKSEYKTVYVEDGAGGLEDKKGVYTIGRDNLAGIPDDVDMVMVDKDNNWLYIANAGDRAKYAEELTAKQTVADATATEKITGYVNKADEAKRRLQMANNTVDYLEKKQAKSHKKEDIAAYQEAITARAQIEFEYEYYNKNIRDLSLDYSKSLEVYTRRLDGVQGWTVEDELLYQKLGETLITQESRLNAVKYYNGMPSDVFIKKYPNYSKSITEYVTNVAAFNELSKRRAVAGDDPVYMDTEAIANLKKNAEVLKKHVDNYNKWDSCTLNYEKGEGLGANLQALLKHNWISKVETISNDGLLGALETVASLNPIGYAITTAADVINNYDYYSKVGNNIYNAFAKPLRLFNPIDTDNDGYADGLFWDEKRKIKAAYEEHKADPTKGINIAQYTDELVNLEKQATSATLSNVFANLDIFDLASIQKEYVAYKMAKNPDLYSEDPKFKKMQEAYKAIHGTDYRGKVDTLKMVYTIFDVSSHAYNDYIYLDASDLKHADGSNYNVLEQILVGMATDLSFMFNTGAKIGEVAAKSIATKAIQNTIEGAFEEVLQDSFGISKAVARDFIKNSDDISSKIAGASYKAMRNTFKESGDEIVESILSSQKNVFANIAYDHLDDFIAASEHIKDVSFIDNAIQSLNKIAPEIEQKTLALSKTAVITSALADASELIEKVQGKLFLAAVPVAGAVKGIYHGMKLVDNLANSAIGKTHIADLINSAVAHTSDEILSDLHGFKVDTLFRMDDLTNSINSINNKMYTAMLETKGKTGLKDVERIFRNWSESTLDETTKHMVSLGLDEFTDILDSQGIKGLQQYAAEKGYSNFDTLLSDFEYNVNTVLTPYGNDLPELVDCFKTAYHHAVDYSKVEELGKHIKGINEHVQGIRDVIGFDDHLFKQLLNASPDFAQANAYSMRKAVYNFMSTANPNWTRVSKDAIDTLHIDANNFLRKLDDVIYEGSKTNADALEAAAQQYVDDIEQIYKANANAAYKDNLYRVTGVAQYSEALSKLSPPHPRDEVANAIMDHFADLFKEKVGETISFKEVADNIIRDVDKFSQMRLDDIELLQKIMVTKGSNTMLQMENTHFIETAEMLCNSNSALNKQLSIYAEELQNRILLETDNLEKLKETLSESEYLTPGGAADVAEATINRCRQLVDTIDLAISNASAVSSTHALYKSMETWGVSSLAKQGFMDAWSGNVLYQINYVMQAYPPDVAAKQIVDMCVTNANQQLAKHRGVFEFFHTYKIDDGVGGTRYIHPNTVNVSDNTAAIKAIADSLSDFPETAEYHDIFFSTTRIASGGSPNDIGFLVRHAEEGVDNTPIVFHRDTPFDIRDNSFAARVYGSDAETAMQNYSKLQHGEALNRAEWEEAVHNFIEEQKEIALKDNKKIRFIGFNSSDAISGDNKFLNDILQASGVSIDTSSAIDLADKLRKDAGSFFITDDDVAKLRMGVADAIRESKKLSIRLGNSPILAYDPSNHYADMLETVASTALDSPKLTGIAGFNELFEELKQNMEAVKNSVKLQDFELAGTANNMAIDLGAARQIIHNNKQSNIRLSSEAMLALQDKLSNNKYQLGYKTIFSKDAIDQWFATDYMSIPKRGRLAEHVVFDDGKYAQEMYDASLKLNSIYNNAKRLDIITEADREDLLKVYGMLRTQFGQRSINSVQGAPNLAHIINVRNLNTQQLYAVNVWLLDKFTEANKYKSPMLVQQVKNEIMGVSKRVGTFLSDDGSKFIRHSVVDYTDPFMSTSASKYLSDTEDGFKFAQELNDLEDTRHMYDNLAEYDELQNLLYSKNDAHGTKEKVLLAQSAAVNKPLVELNERMENIISSTYDEAYKMYTVEKGYEDTMASRLAYVDAVNARKAIINEEGEQLRQNSVKAVLALNEDEFRAHLIRNCAGGIVIQPDSSVLRGVNVPDMLNKFKSYGLNVEEFRFTEQGFDRALVRVYIPELGKSNMDELFAKYNNVHIKFTNESTAPYNGNLRHTSFDASDMTINNGHHIDAFRQLFFDGSDDILDFANRFDSWTNELYSCNMWTDADLKRLVNPYYTDNYVRSLAQSTHQVRKNIVAVNDFATLIDNPYTNSKRILLQTNVYDPTVSVSDNLKNIRRQVEAQRNHLCTVVEHNGKLSVIDYTKELTTDNLEYLLDNTILLDDGMFSVLKDAMKTANVSLKFAETSNYLFKNTAHAYKLYSNTIRSWNIAHYLYLNIGTAVRNMVDSTIKAVNEVFETDTSITDFINNYANAVPDSQWYVNTYKMIKAENGTVDRETIRQFFKENVSDMNKFNLFYSFENTVGADSLVEYSAKETRQESVKYLMEECGINSPDIAEELRKVIDGVYASPKYRVLNSTELAQRATEIHDKCMQKIEKALKTRIKPGALTPVDLDLLSKKLYGYHPTVETWGEIATRYNPLMQLNQRIFNDAETRARFSMYQTFINAGESEAEAMAHVVATQFNYAGIGHVEDFMPFTQYKLYNAVYWFDHADISSIKAAWRYAQANDDGAMDSEEIADMCEKYMARQYFLYEKGDVDYDAFVRDNTTWMDHLLHDGVDSYLGLPREFQAGSIDLNGTHFIKLGNSFVEETDLIISAAIGALNISYGLSDMRNTKEWSDKMRIAYNTLKSTPLYDSLYSPWKSYIEFLEFAHDKEVIREENKTNWAHYNGVPTDVYNALDHRDFGDYLKEFMADQSTHSLAIQGIPLAGVVISNLLGRIKAGKLNYDLALGDFQAMWASTDVQQALHDNFVDLMCDYTGGIMPSLIGTNVKPAKEMSEGYQYHLDTINRVLLKDPTNYIDYLGRLQKLGFSEAQSKNIVSNFSDLKLSNYNRAERIALAEELFAKGYSLSEIANLLRQTSLGDNILDTKEFRGMYMLLPDYLKHDKALRSQVVDYYKALGMTTQQAWARIISHPSTIIGNKLVELTPGQVRAYSKMHQDTFNALTYKFEPTSGRNGMPSDVARIITDNANYRPPVYKNALTDDDWKAYWDTMHSLGFYPTSEQWHNTMDYLRKFGNYSYTDAMRVCLTGIVLDSNGKLVDVQSLTKSRQYNTFDKSAYEHPLGYADFNAYRQTLPDFIKYEKGGFKRINDMLKELGITDYNTRLSLIQQGAYLLDVTGIPGLANLLSSTAPNGMLTDPKAIKNINDLLLQQGNKLIKGSDGKYYMLANCSGLQRPRKSFTYSKRNYNYSKKQKTYYRKGGKGRRSYAMDRMYSPYGHGRGRGGKKYYNKYRQKSYRSSKSYMPKLMSYSKYTKSKYYTRSPFVTGNNVSTYSGFTNYRGSNKSAKPFLTNSYRTSTYSLQNFLHGASYGMRKVYRIDARQYKTGAYSTKKAYPAAYRNIAVAYRHNLYKDMYAKYGASRMMMRANKAGYSNASIVRLRRNEIYNRERYAERRDRKAETKKKTAR